MAVVVSSRGINRCDVGAGSHAVVESCPDIQVHSTTSYIRRYFAAPTAPAPQRRSPHVLIRLECKVHIVRREGAPVVSHGSGVGDGTRPPQSALDVALCVYPPLGLRPMHYTYFVLTYCKQQNLADRLSPFSSALLRSLSAVPILPTHYHLRLAR